MGKRCKRGKKEYTREEVWDILEEIKEDLKASCEDNEVMREEVDVYFDNYEL